ncbi:MAG: DUF2306 domain-containing protein [Chitinophagaceae bacterium]|nr:DUF2306 domain-containing protein [Chitinophagaceae bacterium]
MQSPITPALIIHIAAGSVALLTGLLSILAKKGRKVHRTSGKIYFWCMLIVAFSAAYMSLLYDLSFFLMLSMFAFYSTFAGYRAIRNKSRKADWLDWLMVGSAIVTCGFMITSGSIILIVFGSIFGFLSISDAKDFSQKEPFTIKSKRWLAVHISRMMTAYIATTTAFVVVNLSEAVPKNLNVVVWLAPTALLTPLIFFFINKYMNKKKATPLPAEIYNGS